MGLAIILAFTKLVRFSEELLTFGDKKKAQVYQFIFMETVGFKVDKVYIHEWLKKAANKLPQLGSDQQNELNY